MDVSRKQALQLGLGAFLLLLVSPFLPLLEVVAFAIGAWSLLLFWRDARAQAAARWPSVALALLVASFLALFLGGPFAAQAFARGDIGLWTKLVWLYAVANVALAGAFYAAPHGLAGERAKLLLGLALGIAVAVAASTTYREVDAGQRYGAALHDIEAAHPGTNDTDNATRAAQLQQAQDAFQSDAESLLAAQGIPYVVFAWAYATMLGVVTRAQRAEQNA